MKTRKWIFHNLWYIRFDKYVEIGSSNGITYSDYNFNNNYVGYELAKVNKV